MNKDDDSAANTQLTVLPGDSTILKRMERWAKYFACSVIIVATLVLIGWQFDIEFLKRPIPLLAAMNPASAVLFIFSGFSLLLLRIKSLSSLKFPYGKILAVIVLLIGLLQFIFITTGLNISFDPILYPGKVNEDIKANIFSRMSPKTALCFMLTGISLLLVNFETRSKKMPAHIIAIVVALFGLLSIIGYLYKVRTTYGVVVYIPMAIHTAICFLFISFSILFATPGKGITKELASRYSGSVIARFLVPVAIIIPILLGFLRMWGGWSGIIPFELGTTLLVLTITTIFLVMTWFIIVSLNKRDKLKQEAENELRASEEQIQTIFNAAPDAVIVIDEAGKIVKWNPKAEMLFGWEENEVIGKLLSETIIPDRFRGVHTNGFKHFLRTGEGPLLGQIIETNALKKDNTEIDVALNISATSKIRGRYLFIGFVRDITERKKTEQQIQKQNQDIQDFIDSMSTLSVKLSTEGKILMVNKIALQASGLSMEELLKTNFTEGQWWTFDPEVHTRVRNAFNNACSGTPINYNESIFVFGQVLTINFSLIPILNPDGSVDYIVGEGRDITAQKIAEKQIKESESMFSTLFYKSPIMKCITEVSTGKFMEVNDAFADFVGYRKEEMLGKTSLELNMLVVPEKRDLVVKEIERTGFVRDEETQIKDKNGKPRWLSTNIDKISVGGKGCLLTAALDITSRKEAEEKIRLMNLDLEKRVEEKTNEIIHSEKKFRNLIENSKDIISLTDENFKTIYRSPSAERITGFTKEERVKFGFIELIHPDDQERMKKTLKEVLNKPEEPIPVTYRTRHKEGHYIWLEGIMTNMLEDESIKAVVINLRDVTENKEAEENLRKSVKEITDYKYALDESSIVAITDQTGIIKYVNDNFCKISKYSREELIGQDHRIINSGYHPKEFIRNLWVTIANGKIWKGELKNKAKDGSIYWVDTTIVPFLNDKGKPYQYVAIRSDITVRKIAEEDVKNTLKEITDYKYALDESSIVAITDQKGIIKYANNNFCKISKYNAEELIGQDHRIINSGYHSKDFIRNLWVTIANGKIWKGELKNKAKDGTVYWVDTTIVPFLNDEGKPYQYVAIRSDITERKQVEENLQRSLKEIADYKYALDESSIVAITDQTGIIKYVNDNFCKISKYSVNELIGQDHRIINSGYHPKEFIRNLWVTIANGKIWKGELKNKAKDGTIYWVDTTIVPFLNDKGKPYQYVAIRSDITVRKIAEEDIKNTLKEITDYKYALDESSIVAITDQKGIIKYANNNFCKISKYNAEELIGQDHRIINSGYHSKDFIRNLWVTIANGKIWKGELKNKAKDGSIYWVDTTIVPFLDDKRKPYQYVAIRSDITKRKKMEESLASSEMRFRSLIENSAEGIALTDEYANSIYRSPAAEKMMGNVTRENTITLAHPEDVENLKRKRAESLAKPGVPISFECRFKNESGHYIWLEGVMTNLLHIEAVNAMVTNFRDITLRKEAEQKLIKSEKIYKTIASSIPGSVICLMDREYRYLLVEGDMLEKLGYSKEGLLGKKAEDILTAERFAAVKKDLNRAFDGETVTTESSRSGYDIISRFIPLKDENDHVYTIMTVAIDVTELKKAQRDIAELNRGLEQKIIQRTAELKTSNEELEAFSYSVSHDLRAPLRAIIGFTAILEEDYSSKLDDEAKRITSIIKNNTMKMGHLIDDLLAFSRLGRQDVVKTSLATDDLVKDVINTFSDQTKHLNIEWVIRCLPEVKADANTLRQVWVNLISNAIKYSGTKERPRIEIGSVKQQHQVLFFVKDNGVGFDAKYKDKLFRVFQRLHPANEFEGTGVGLAIVEKIISKHAGKVWAEAAIDKGATFWFSLPDE